MTQRIAPWLFAVLVFCRPAAATLGGAPSAFSRARAELTSEAHAGYVVRESIDGAGSTHLREYVANNKVFAVVWRGQHAPDWDEALGDFAALVIDARKGHPLAAGRRAGFSVRRGEVVFEQSGTMRGVHGRAYLPGHLPVGVQEGDIHE